MNNESKGKLCNNLIVMRASERDPLFFRREDGTIVANLDGYAIVPIEEYNALIKPVDGGLN